MPHPKEPISTPAGETEIVLTVANPPVPTAGTERAVVANTVLAGVITPERFREWLLSGKASFSRDFAIDF